MVEITLRVNGTERTERNLSNLADKLRDLRTPNRAVSVQFASWVGRNYDSQGGLVGGWAPVAQATSKRKQRAGKEKILIWTGHLRASVLPFADDRRAGIGTEVMYGATHEHGDPSRNIPRRRFLPNQQEALEMGTKVYEFYAAKVTQEANR